MFSPAYDFYDRKSKSLENNDEIISLSEAITFIKDSVADEQEDEEFYNILIGQAPSEKEKNIIRDIRDDEIKHGQILRQLYYEFTGNLLPAKKMLDSNVNSMDYSSNLEKALFGELNAVSKYRKILGTMPSGNAYTLLMSIMTDEIRHVIQYNFLIQNVK